jgi:hypothetical protein
MSRSTPHAPKTTDYRVDSQMDPNQPASLETPRRPGHKAPEPNPNPQRPGDDERDQGLVGGAAPTAPAKQVNPEAQRRAEEIIRRETQA